MQRLFSTFPGGWPGVGLLVLRLAAAIPLMIGLRPELQGLPHAASFALHVIAIVAGIFLLAGFWTPFSAFAGTILEVWCIFTPAGEPGVHLLLAALGLGLVMLGPGAWSVDARLFGRKRIDIRTH